MKAIKSRGVSPFYRQVHLTLASEEEVICQTLCGRELIEDHSPPLHEASCRKCRNALYARLGPLSLPTRELGYLYVLFQPIFQNHFIIGTSTMSLCRKSIADQMLILPEEYSDHVSCRRCREEAETLPTY